VEILRAISFCLNYPKICIFFADNPALSFLIGLFFIYFIRNLPYLVFEKLLPFLIKRVLRSLLLFLWVLLNRILKHLYARYKKRRK